MCGLVYSENFSGKPVNNDVLQQFDKQRSRGTDGFGLFDGSKGNIVRATTEDKILKWLCKYDSSLIMFHHRLPTSTANTKQNAHPFTTKKHFGDNQYILIHNGNIRNSYTLKDDHEKEGISYRTQHGQKFVDSEALLWDFALYCEGKQKHLKAYGDMAFICVKLTKGKLNKLYFGRNNGRPLKLFKDKKEFFLSSEGKGNDLAVNTLYSWDYKKSKLNKKDLKVPQYYVDVEGYTPTYYSGNYQSGSSWKYPGSDYDDEWGKEHDVTDRYVEARDAALDAVEDFLGGVMEYEHDQDTQELVPAISEQDIQRLVLDYLDLFNGEFESAYWAMEGDYEQLADYKDTDVVIKERRKLEKGMEAIMGDEEYTAGVKYSSVWLEMKKPTPFSEAVLAEKLRRVTA